MLEKNLDGTENIKEDNLNPLDFSFIDFDRELKLSEITGLINGLHGVICAVSRYADPEYVYNLDSARSCVLATHYEGVEWNWSKSVVALFGVYFPPNASAINMQICNPYIRNVAYLFAKNSPAFKRKFVTKEEWLDQANNVLRVLVEELKRAKNRTPLGKLKLLFQAIIAKLKR